MAATTEGILSLDKPAGPTSHDVVKKVRRFTGIRRVGHSGTLDPLATGLLILCIGRATRLAEYIAQQSKTYAATVRLGQETDTYDAEGEIVARHPVMVSDRELSAALDRFRGEIDQIPPMFSAIKRDGKPLYRHAREGQVLERPPRTVYVYELEVLEWKPPHLQIRLVCSSGTYIRSFAHDLGQVLGCGGHISALRRTAVGRFTVAGAAPYEQLTGETWHEYIQPSDMAVGHLPQLVLSVDEAVQLYHGQTVPCQTGQPDAPVVRAYDPDSHFVGVIVREQELWRARKIFYEPKSIQGPTSS